MKKLMLLMSFMVVPGISTMDEKESTSGYREKSILEEIEDERIDSFGVSSFKNKGNYNFDNTGHFSLKNGLFCNYKKDSKSYTYSPRKREKEKSYIFNGNKRIELQVYMPGYFQECKDLEALFNKTAKKYEDDGFIEKGKHRGVKQSDDRTSITYNDVILDSKKPLSRKDIKKYFEGMNEIEKLNMPGIVKEVVVHNNSLGSNLRRWFGEQLLTLGYKDLGYKLRRIKPFKVFTDTSELDNYKKSKQDELKKLFE